MYTYICDFDVLFYIDINVILKWKSNMKKNGAKPNVMENILIWKYSIFMVKQKLWNNHWILITSSRFSAKIYKYIYLYIQYKWIHYLYKYLFYTSRRQQYAIFMLQKISKYCRLYLHIFQVKIEKIIQHNDWQDGKRSHRKLPDVNIDQISHKFPKLYGIYIESFSYFYKIWNCWN